MEMDPLVVLTPDRYRTANCLLDHIPRHEQSGVLTDLIASLQPDDDPSINFVASLVERLADQDIINKFVTFLDQAITAGRYRCAAFVNSQHPMLGWELMNRASEFISQARSLPAQGHGDYGALRSYLNFLKLTIAQSWLGIGIASREMLEACLSLLSADDREVCASCREISLGVLSNPNQYVVESVVWPSETEIWNTIRKLIADPDGLRVTLAYSLWLRWVSFTPGHKEASGSYEYWQLLQQGLTRGDAEQRKLCLNILRTSTSRPNMVAVSMDEKKQYHRYCTVFETIVLGRYINQIQECEKDLDFLSVESCVETKWLYTLLASALDGRMQDSNRKFIGNWVMKSYLSPTPEFLSFFRDYFLPWATQGQLFVSSLKRKGDVLRCLHGDLLARFVQRLRQSASHRPQVVEAVIDFIYHRRNSMFAYATVYLLEGLGTSLEDEHVEMMDELRRFPEVARDYVSYRATGVALSQEPSTIPSRREVLEKSAIEKCHTSSANSSDLDDLWSDLEYLEFPKRLLMVTPRTILKAEIMIQAIKDRILAASLAEKVRVLGNIAQTKTFLFAPLACAIRDIVFTTSSTNEVLNLADFVTCIADNPPEPTIDLMLEEATCSLASFSYEYYFGHPPSYGFAALLDLVSRLYEHQNLIETILDRVLLRWKAQRIPPQTVSAWKRTLQLQVLYLCFEQYEPTTTSKMQSLLEDLFHILAIEPLPHYRYLLQATVVRFLMRHSLEDALLSRLLTKDHHSNPKHLASVMKIGVILACRAECSEFFALQLATTFVPLAASSKVVIRHEAQWQVPILMDRAQAQGWTSIASNPAFAALDSYIRSLERFQDPPPERQIGKFDPERDNTLSHLVEGEWLNLDQMEVTVTTHEDFVNLLLEDLPPDAPPSCIPLGVKINRPVIPTPQEPDSASNTKPLAGVRTFDEVSALQTKGTAYLAHSLLDSTTLAFRLDNLIVVASLVDNPYNLGGISRVSEIFGASALCLQNQNILSNKDFQSTSVSSHLHLPFVQLSGPGVPGYLAQRKQEGFTIVGIEQTDRSVMLGSARAVLPEKVVLVIGSEKEGIPALVLTACDMLVEIPQQGITRSLNVQTAVSIILYEYARQHNRRGA